MPKKAITKGFPPIITSIPLLLFRVNFSKSLPKKSQLGNHPIEILKGSKTPFLDHFLSLGKGHQQD